ncbi:MAG: hypothetical protein VYC17_06000 [Nitrospinota bacterium]|nr:hypothetical protein [Nitrospinota bacterium]
MRFIFPLLASGLLLIPSLSSAFDWTTEGRARIASRYIVASPEGFGDFDTLGEFRLGVNGNAIQKKTWSLDYEILGDINYIGGPARQARLARELDADFFRAWFRVDKGQWRFRGGRQEILFGAGVLFRPLGFFDLRIISGVLPQTRGVDGIRLSYFYNETTTLQGWVVPAKKSERSITGLRWEGEIGDWETGFVVQYKPKSNLKTLPNFDLELVQLGYHLKSEYEIGYWSEGRLDIEQNLANRSLRFDNVIGVDYTFSSGDGLHLLVEYFLSTREASFLPIDPRGDRTFHQLGFMMDQPVGIATIWRLFGFYDIFDGSFQVAPQIEYSVTDEFFVYLQGNWGGNVKRDEDVGIFFRKASVFTGTESSAGLSLVYYF